MNKIYRYNDLIFVEGDTKSGYLRPFEAKTLRMREAGSAATYEKYRDSWQLIGTLGHTHRIDGDRLVVLRKRASNPKTTNRSVSFPLTLLERLDNLAREEDRSFSWIVVKLISKGLGDDK